MNKAILIQHIVEKLTVDISLYLKAASAARAEATHEQSKAENKYDTRGLEASYLATEVTVEGQEVMVITPQSPLGRQLIGHRQGDSVKIDLAGRSETHRIHRVS